MKNIKLLMHMVQASLKKKVIVVVIGIAVVAVGTITYGNYVNNDKTTSKISLSSNVTKDNAAKKESVLDENNKGSEIKEKEKTSSPLSLKAPESSPVVNTPVVKATTPVETLSDIREQVIEKHTGVANTPVAKAPVANAPVAKAPVANAPVAKSPVANAPVAKAPVVKAPVVKAPVTKAPVVVVKAPVVIKNYNQVTVIHSLRQGDLVTSENPYVSARIKKFNSTTISGVLVTLMRTTSSYLANDELRLSDAKGIWVGKYVGNKYKVKSLRYQEIVLPCKEVEETPEHYLERVKEKGLMNYKPSSSIKFDEYSIMEKEGDRSNDTVIRLTIEMENK